MPNVTEAQIRSWMDKHTYGGRGRIWHPTFVEYIYGIVLHEVYDGMPSSIDDEGRIRWNAPSHRPPGGQWSNLHDERLDWWKIKAEEMGIPLEGYWISRTAKTIHPFGNRPCQTCGKVMNLAYVYPTKRTTEKINRIEGLVTEFDFYDFQNINEIIHEVIEQVGDSALIILGSILKIPEDECKTSDQLLAYLNITTIPGEPRGILSPGAMSNAPDRLDGFHSYNLCCRSKEDTGRTPENLRSYGLDRRAFEYWTDGDWAAASYLMNQNVTGQCENCERKEELTADHIGPLSLGFCHRPKFNSLCRSCNSSKNNRMSYRDVQTLIEDEQQGETVVSWFAKELWDRLKDGVSDDVSALHLSKILRANHHQYLMLLSEIYQLGFEEFLTSLLHFECAKYRYEVIGFSGVSYEYEKLDVTERQDTYASSMVDRIKRIAFESLELYGSKGNRNAILFKDSDLNAFKDAIIEALGMASNADDYIAIKQMITEYMVLVAEKLIKKGVPRGHWK